MKKILIIPSVILLLVFTAFASGPGKPWMRHGFRPGKHRHISSPGPLPARLLMHHRFLPPGAVCFSTSAGPVWMQGGRFFRFENGCYLRFVPGPGIYFPAAAFIAKKRYRFEEYAIGLPTVVFIARPPVV